MATPTDPRRLDLALIGFGTVGQAFVRLIAAERERLLAEERLVFRVTAVATRRSGSARDAGGLDLAALLDRAARGTRHGPPAEAAELAATADADVIVETLPLEPHSGREAIAVTRAALAAGRSVVSANKGPVAHAVVELRALAGRNGVHYRFESSVADGMPVFSLVEYALPAVRIERIVATLNSTTNVVLAALADGDSVEAGVERAQAAGIAEADVGYDLDGWDAAIKLCALAGGLWGRRLRPADIERSGVHDVTPASVREARARGGRLIGIATLRRGDARPEGSVRVEEISAEHPFFPLSGASLAIRFESSLISPITISSSNPTPVDTAYGLLADILHVARSRSTPSPS